jgi:nicotinate phosphoribosyltransferase
MTGLSDLYRGSLSLLTDLYQLTMAYGYWKHGLANRQAVFHLTFRKCPFDGAYAVACGLGSVIDLLQNWKFTSSDTDYLGTLCGADGRPLFDTPFLQALSQIEFSCDVDAIPEGTVVFPHEPLIRLRGPLWQAQILETALLNLVNFQTLIATKSARICNEARGEPVLEFGLRRAQGIDGSLSASRAAFIGGCSSTSNVLAGKLYGIPVRGTHAHSWVMAFGDEQAAFLAYAEAMPNNCVFLVDTYDTLTGVRHAVAAGKVLRERGYEMLGIRLDSGDLTELSLAARKILDDGGFPKAVIVASNDLDEYLVRDLKHQGAVVNTWGIGTKLVTAFDQPALGGVYKLSAIQSADGTGWEHRIKLSEQPAKMSNPGIQQVRRCTHDGELVGDMIFDELQGIESGTLAQSLTIRDSEERDLLVPVFRNGQCVYRTSSIAEIRDHARRELSSLPAASRRLTNPTAIPVLLEPRLLQRKQELAAESRRTN